MLTPASSLPWTVEPNRARIEIHTAHDKSIALCGKIADAEYIVQACNAFPALVEALEECFTEPFAHCLVKEDKDALYRRVCAINDTVRAALALARGEKGGE